MGREGLWRTKPLGFQYRFWNGEGDGHQTGGRALPVGGGLESQAVTVDNMHTGQLLVWNWIC